MVAIGSGVNNGALTKIAPRYTPYHVPHQTEIAGFMTFLHGDMRFYNNIFVQQKIRMELQKYLDSTVDYEWDDNNLFTGTSPYENYPTWEEYEKQFEGYCGMGSEPSDRYYNPLPVWAEGNVYFNGAKAMSNENAVIDNEHTITLSVEERNGKYSIKTNLGDYVQKLKATTLISTETLGMAFEPEQKFENPDGTSIVFNEDYFGNSCGLNPLAGPFAENSLKTI